MDVEAPHYVPPATYDHRPRYVSTGTYEGNILAYQHRQQAISWKLALRVLRSLSRALETNLLSLLDTGVPGKKSSTLQVGSVSLVNVQQSTRDSVPNRLRLTTGTPTNYLNVDIEAALRACNNEWRSHRQVMQLSRSEIVLGSLAVNNNLPTARQQSDSCDRGLTLAGPIVISCCGH